MWEIGVSLEYSFLCRSSLSAWPLGYSHRLGLPKERKTEAPGFCVGYVGVRGSFLVDLPTTSFS